MAKKVGTKKAGKKIGKLILDQLQRLEDKLDVVSGQLERAGVRIAALEGHMEARRPLLSDAVRRDLRQESRQDERRFRSDRRFDMLDD